MFPGPGLLRTDTQVQRYLTGSRSDIAGWAMFNAAAKIPMQGFILFLGDGVRLYIFQPPPNPVRKQPNCGACSIRRPGTGSSV